MADDKTPPVVKITTRLGDQQDGGGDARLILASVQCSEGFSKPYFLDCVMNTLDDLTIDRFEMLNTRATVFVRLDDKETYTTRKGVFESFGRAERRKRTGASAVKTYHGRIVPTFKLMEREILFRIFQDMSAIAIIQSCFKSFKVVDLGSYLNLSRVQSDAFPTLEYCVQFGESTLNFVSRLMAYFGVSYYFDHETGDTETMVLCSGPVVASNFKACAASANSIDFDPEATVLAKYDRKYQIPTLRVSLGDFNPVVPTRPIQSGDVLLPNVDPSTSFAYEQFPYPFLTNNTKAHAIAEVVREISEGETLTIEAVSKNPTMFAAKTLTIEGKVLDVRDLNSTLLITDLSFYGFETRFLRGVGSDLFQFFIEDLILTPVKTFAGSLIDATKPDLATAMAAAGLNNYVKAYMQVQWTPPPAPPAKPASNPNVTAYFFAGAVAYLTALIPSAVSILRDLLDVVADILQALVTVIGVIVDIVTAPLRLLDLLGIHVMAKIDAEKTKMQNWLKKGIDWLLRHDPDPSGYSNALVAMDLSGNTTTINLRLPEFSKPIAYGPHLATVIGDDGTDTSKGEISADALGRVRVRFPWDRRPTQTTTTSASTTQDAAQFSTGVNTCWLRVSEGWASQGFGTQFMPRIGDEVIVEFLAGDPDRPIITGRVYNARGKGTPNLPFPGKGTEGTTISTPDDLINLQNSATSAFQRSGIKTRSTPQTQGSLKRFHLLRFDDTANKEQLIVRSQQRLDITAFGSRYETIAGNRNLTVGWIDTKHQVVGGNYIAKVYQDYHLHIGDPAGPFNGGHRYELVEKDYQLHVKNDTNVNLENNCNINVGGAASLTVGSFVLSATKKISLVVGSSSIVIDPGGIYLTGPMIYENSGGSPDLAADVTIDPIKNPTQADPGDK
jgi:uncharacterized protein involved in type VI secretion and phage assembly